MCANNYVYLDFMFSRHWKFGTEIICVGFEVLTEVLMEVTIFWDVLLARWFLARLILSPEDGGDAFLRNVG
jgi:hypothetical protein